jgi:hypothetical protein
LATSFRCYVTVDGSSRTEQNLARRTLGAGVADRRGFLPQLQLQRLRRLARLYLLAGDEGPLPPRLLKRSIGVNRAQIGELMMMRRVTIALIALGCTATASADDIVLQIGGRFSIYAPSSCHRLEQSHFSFVLDCDFQGRRSRFYLREFPGQLNETFDPRKFPPSKSKARAYLDSALRAVVDELDPSMIPRLKFTNWEATQAMMLTHSSGKKDISSGIKPATPITQENARFFAYKAIVGD